MAPTFAHHIPGTESLARIRVISEAFGILHNAIKTAAPAVTRERLNAITFLETAEMWAVKAITVNDPESKVVT